MILVMALAGTGVGLGLLAIAYGLTPRPEPLPDVLARLQGRLPARSPDTIRVAAAEPGWLSRMVGDPIAGLLARLGVRAGGPSADLAITGRSSQRHLADKAVIAIAGLLLPWAMTATFWLAGVRLSLSLPAWAGLLLAAGGWLVPDLAVRQEAARRRADVRHTLGVVLDLTGIALAGGAGVEGALHDAAETGTDWVSAELRRALATARLRNQPPWAALAELGGRLGVDELVELGATAGLAGTEGARVRASLLAKAASLRAHQLAEAEADAHAATERMSLPVVLLFSAFMLFIGFPAVTRILTGGP